VKQNVFATDRLRGRLVRYAEGVNERSPRPSPDGKSPCDAALADDLGWSLGVVFRGYVAAANAAVEELPGGPRGYQVMAAAAEGEIGSQLALANHLGIDRTVMTYLLDDLEGAGFIERQPDPVDRRARRVVVTAKGTKLLGALDGRLQEAEAHLLSALGPEAQSQFRAHLSTIAANVNSLDPVDNPCSLADNVDAELPTPKAPASAGRRA
jgi:DNA-binding MarR family transcriptional regulator